MDRIQVRNSIRAYVKSRPPICGEVFASVLANESPATQGFIKSIQGPVRKKLIQGGVPVSPAPEWLLKVFELYSVEDVVIAIFATEQMNRKSRNPLVRIQQGIYSRFLRWGVGFVTDLKLAHLSDEDAAEAYLAVILAGLYRGV